MPLANLDIDLLRSFAAVADTGSFTAAGEVVARTQSAISIQIKRLEEIVGKRVFERTSRSLTLTPAGATLLDYARRILELNDESVRRIMEPPISGEIRLGITEYFVPAIAADLGPLRRGLSRRASRSAHGPVARSARTPGRGGSGRADRAPGAARSPEADLERAPVLGGARRRRTRAWRAAAAGAAARAVRFARARDRVDETAEAGLQNHFHRIERGERAGRGGRRARRVHTAGAHPCCPACRCWPAARPTPIPAGSTSVWCAAPVRALTSSLHWRVSRARRWTCWRQAGSRRDGLKRAAGD